MGLKTALIDTSPKDMRNKGSINLGLEIVREKLNADVFNWWDIIPICYDQLAFNVFYPMHILNIGPFLRNNKFDNVSKIAGGQGINRNGILSKIIDKVYMGEFDTFPSKEFTKNGNSVVELTRGCKYKCRFCEYSYVHGGEYREKSIGMVIDQLRTLKNIGIDHVNMLSSNLAGYSHIDLLIETATKMGITIANTDSCIYDIHKLFPYMKHLPKMIKIGVESFDENTRRKIGKYFSDTYLEEVILKLIDGGITGIHIYLIYGLPGDDYDKWLKWIEKLRKIRESFSKIKKNLFGHEFKYISIPVRIEFSITNFEPCQGTPMGNASPVNFSKKEDFLLHWADSLINNEFYKPKDGKILEYKNSRGRFGRKENSYKLLMMLKRGGPELTTMLLKSKGVSRSVLDSEAIKIMAMAEQWG